jgi:electron transport complex protein RnfG
MMVGIDKTGNVIGISIISHAETPSLGAVAAEDNAAGEAFRSQFAGLSGTLAVSKDGGTVDAISGATITSRAVVEGVNAALQCVAREVRS